MVSRIRTRLTLTAVARAQDVRTTRPARSTETALVRFAIQTSSAVSSETSHVSMCRVIRSFLNSPCDTLFLSATQTCSDGFMNQNETDVDCGGSTCSKCAKNRRCAVNQDCQSDTCQNTVCGTIIFYIFYSPSN